MPASELGDAAVEDGQTDDDEIVALAAEDAGVDEAEDEGGEGEAAQAEGARITRWERVSLLPR